MARLALGVVAAVGSALAQTDFKQAGVCSRCHVVQVIEWSSSKHTRATVACQSCHGPSAGHVANERNEVKPDRLPRGAAIAGLCATCHAQGCPKTSRRDDCQSCHHQHALTNPNEKLEPLNFGDEQRIAEFRRKMDEGERLVRERNWAAARQSFADASRAMPSDRRAKQRLRMCERRTNPGLAGVETVGTAFDDETGLPKQVRIASIDLVLLLVPGGEADLGSDKFLASKPVHSVRVEPFYLGRTEVTQKQWLALTQENPSVEKGEDLPVHNVSWEDARNWIAKLGAGFRLPTEAEWEFAAGAAGEMWKRGDTSKFAPNPVGKLASNQAGLHDMYGNVAEWCSSLLRPYPYSSRDGREDAAGEGLRVIRGGSHADSAEMIHRELRHGERSSRRIPWNGLRVAMPVQ